MPGIASSFSLKKKQHILLIMIIMIKVIQHGKNMIIFFSQNMNTSLKISFYLSFESGAGSSYKSLSEKGYFVRIGGEYYLFDIFKREVPCYFLSLFSAGYRFMAGYGRLAESSLQLGVGKITDSPGEAINILGVKRPINIGVSYLFFLTIRKKFFIATRLIAKE